MSRVSGPTISVTLRGQIVAFDDADAQIQPQGLGAAPQVFRASRRIEATGIGDDADAPVEQRLEMRQDVASREIGGEALPGAARHAPSKPAHHGFGEEIEDDVVQPIGLSQQLGDAHPAVVEKRGRRADPDNLAHLAIPVQRALDRGARDAPRLAGHMAVG